MNNNPGMLGQQQMLQQQMLMQQLQQQQLLQRQQQQQQHPQQLSAVPAAAVPNYAAVAQMQAMLASQAAAGGMRPVLLTQPGLQPGALAIPAAAAPAAGLPPAAAVQAAVGMGAPPLRVLQAGGLPPAMPQAAPMQAAMQAIQQRAVQQQAQQQQAVFLQPPRPAAAAAAAAASVPAHAALAQLQPSAQTGSSLVRPADAVAVQAPAPPPAAAAGAAGAEGSADPRFEKVGFAKLLGDGLEYYIKKYEIVMGRRSKAVLDVVLGDSAVLSRHHCRIVYNFQAKKWQLLVEGKNGVTVNGEVKTPASGPCNLASQDLLQAGDMSFYFLLPKPQRKPKPKAPAAPAAAAAAAVAGSNATSQQRQPGTPVLGGSSTAGAAPAAAAVLPTQGLRPQGSSPMLPCSSPRLPQAAGMLPGLLPGSAAAGAEGLQGLQAFSSGPLLAGVGLGMGAGGAYLGMQGPGGVPVGQGGYLNAEGGLAGSQDLLQSGLGDGMDEGMMEA